MEIRITNKDVAWSYAAQIFQYGSGLFILPIVLNKLSSNELGVWYVFLAATALINLLDFGFSPIIMRNVSYILSGSKKLEKEGVNSNETDGHIDFLLLYTLIKTSRVLYGIIALISFLILSSIGTFYIHGLLDKFSLALSRKIMIAWGIYLVGTIINSYFAYFSPLLQGRGQIKEASKVAVASKITYVIFSYLLLFLGYGLIAIATCYLLSSLVNRYLSYRYFFDKELLMEFENFAGRKIKINETFKIIWFNASKLGLNAIGAFLILRANTILCSSFLGLGVTAEYGLSLQIFSILSSFSLIFFNTYIPLFNQDRFYKNKDKLKERFALANFIGLAFFLVGFISVIMFGNSLLIIIGSHTRFLNTKFNFVLGVYLFLNMQHGIAATFITTNNEVPFVKATLLSGAVIILLSFLLLKFTNLGAWSIILPPLAVGLAYNNWKWPLVVLRDLEMNYFGLLMLGMRAFSDTLKKNVYEFIQLKK